MAGWTLFSQAQHKHSRVSELQHTPEDLRWATPEIVARYRAKRLRLQGKTLVDVGCGIGFQTVAFAQVFEKVYAVEIDSEKIKRAEENARILGLKNIEFIHGDALDPAVIRKVKTVEILFSDPERLPEEEERAVDTIQPDLAQLLAAYAPLTEKIAVELPPQIKSVPFPDGELEYLSVGGKLNRLTWYSPKLKQSPWSAVVLPSEERLEMKEGAKLSKREKLGTYLYEADPAVVKAGLLAELSADTETALFSEGKAVFFTGKSLIKSAFFANTFKVLGSGSFQEKEVISLLRKTGAGKVVLRYPVDPKEYWNIRKKWEQPLSGKKKVCLFQFGSRAAVGERV